MASVNTGEELRIGKKWEEEEEKQLYDEFISGKSFEALPDIHRRGVGAIRYRLERLGLISELGERVEPVPQFSYTKAKQNGKSLRDESPKAIEMSFSTSKANQVVNPHTNKSEWRNHLSKNELINQGHYGFLSEMPQEKLLKFGVETLDTPELLALILRTGTNSRNVLEISQEVWKTFDLSDSSQLVLKELTELDGIGEVKACQLLALSELSSRLANKNDKCGVSRFPQRESLIMNRKEILEILFSLANGINPDTGEIFDENSPYQSVKITRALFYAIRELENAPNTETFQQQTSKRIDPKPNFHDQNTEEALLHTLHTSHQKQLTKKENKDKQIDLDEEDNEIFEILREWRTNIAKEENLPAYMVLTNKALIYMAHFKPQSIDALLEMHGIGPAKAEKYGKDILDILSKFEADGPQDDVADFDEDIPPF